MTRICLIGPTYPFRGGISHYTTLLANALRQVATVRLVSFSRQYPQWLFPGRGGDKDPSQRPLTTEADYLIDTVNPLTWAQTGREIVAWQPDILLFNWWHPYFTPAWTIISRWVKARRPQTEIITICHNVLPHENGRLLRLLLPLATRLAIGSSHRFLVHSRPDRQKLLGILPAADVRVVALPTYRALGQGMPSDQLPIELPHDRPLLLFCGLIRPYKGLDILLEAVPHIQRPFHLLVAGEFWQSGETTAREQIARLGIAEQVTVLNQYLPDEWLQALIQRAVALVLPYRSATQSAVVQLAFGNGRPVITTRVGGLAEAVVDGQTGLVVPPEDPLALARAIDRLLADPHQFDAQLAATQAGNGRFSWQQLVQQILLQQTPASTS